MAKTIMFQGTASGVGKSTLAIGLCRILKQDGYNTAHFKAQNLSNTVHLLNNGQQMARSQAIEAFASKITPSTDMNPVLLKPCDVYGSQVILNGNSLGYIKEYDGIKNQLFDEAYKAYKRLCQKHEIIVVEGAGSPVELNLKENDIVNMGFAKKADAPVILVADINRGGVFASIYGTIMLLSKDEQDLVKGIIINKFSGSHESFSSGIKIIEEITHKPVIGVVPNVEIDIEDEDCLTDTGLVKTEKSISERLTNITYNEHLEKEFDKLTDILRRNLDIKKIYSLMGI